jgi:hypothetical protein
MASNLATAYVGRDSFARGEYARFTFSTKSDDAEKQYTCDWCGSIRKRVYVYLWQNDSIGSRVPRRDDARKEHMFCGKGCHDSYFG